MTALTRQFVPRLIERLSGQSDLIQILIGPRQVGKTYAAVEQIQTHFGAKACYASADHLAPPGPEWLAEQWERARAQGAEILILDEVQKVTRWSEAVKMLWDRDLQHHRRLRLLLLGSSSYLMQKGLRESLAGRFELTRCWHWLWPECREFFGWDLDTWLVFGGYPKSVQQLAPAAVALAADAPEWRSYIRDSLIEPVLAKDVLQMQTVQKPALLRQLFFLACQAPAQVVSYEKMAGQLSEAGHTGTLADYLHLLKESFVCAGLPKYSRGIARQKASSPKLIVFNNAMVSAANPLRLPAAPGLPPALRDQVRQEWLAWRGRLAENAVGAVLHAFGLAQGWELFYWRERDQEVDFVLETPANTFAIEVKTGPRTRAAGLATFLRRYPRAVPVVVGDDQFPLEQFFTCDAEELLVRLVHAGLKRQLGTEVILTSDFGMLNFKDPASGRSGSYFPHQLDANRILRHLRGIPDAES